MTPGHRKARAQQQELQLEYVIKRFSVGSGMQIPADDPSPFSVEYVSVPVSPQGLVLMPQTAP